MATAPLPTVDILLPGLFPTQRLDGIASSQPRLPALELLLARSDRGTLNESTAIRWLMRRFGVHDRGDLPAGALSLLGDGGQPGNACWLRADPVHLRVNRDQLVLAGHRVFEISQGDAEIFTDALNRHFSRDGFVFYPLRPERWYLRAPAPAEIVTTPLAEAVGRHIDPLLPQGTQALAWHGLFNEIQMLLHSVPLNADREARGVLPVNSVWLWGAGPLPASVERPYELVVANDPVACGLARAGGCRAVAPECDILPLLADQPRGNVLVYDNTLDDARACGEEAGVTAALEHLEQSVFAPLLESLKGRGLESIRVLTFTESGGASFEATRLSLWRFWRSAMELSHYPGRSA